MTVDVYLYSQVEMAMLKYKKALLGMVEIMKNRNFKNHICKISCAVFVYAILLVGMHTTVMYGAENPNMSNLVVFVNFADTVLEQGTTSHAHSSTSLGKCFEDADYTFELFDGENSSGEITNQRAMKQYLNTVSYGELRLDNVFPQYDETNHKIIPLTLSENAQSYVDNDSKMIAEIIALLNAEYENEYDNAKLDYVEAGVIDNLMIVVACDDDLYNRLFSGHKSTYAGNDVLSIHSSDYLVRDYTLVTEGGAYLGINSSGLLIHEFMHTLGYPDLYHRPSGNEITRIPVGMWDIMSQESYTVQYPLAYMRQHISGWLDLPTVTTSQTGYTLTAASATNQNNKNTQAVILKTPYSDTEFFVIEYRKQGQNYIEYPDTQDFDCRIPGSGIIIYRINTAYQTNVAGAPFMVYVYRPGDTYDSNGYENANADNLYIDNSYLSLESGRTSYGSSDMTKSLSDNAITYSDGTNSGIVIRNVGSATGDTISFDISFSDGNGQYWTTVTSGHENEASTQISSFIDADGTVYYIKGQNNGTSNALYQYKNSWTKLGSAPASYMPIQLVKSNGVIYIAYIDRSSYAHLAKWNSGTWVDIYKSSEYAGEVALTQSSNQVYFAYTNQNADYIKAFSYNSSVLQTLNSYADSSINYAANPSMIVVNGNVYVLYREFNNQDKLVIRKFDSTTKSWSDFGNLSINSSYAKLYSNGNKLYLVANAIDGNKGSYLYEYDLSTNAGWKVLGDSFINEYLSEMDLCFNGDVPYIAYMDGSVDKAYVKKLANGNWAQVGTVLSNDIVTGLDISCQNSKLYVTYRNSVSNHTYIRNFQVEISSVTPENPVVPETPVVPSTPSVTKNGWILENGSWYYYSNGYRQTGWINDNGTWYYLNSAGVMQTGWIKDGGIWYYLNGSGAMLTGWIKDGGTWYYLNSSGAMLTGWIKDGGTWYYLNGSGAMLTGWIKDRGTWYYLNDSGAMQTGWVRIGGKQYYFNSSGAWIE